MKNYFYKSLLFLFGILIVVFMSCARTTLDRTASALSPQNLQLDSLKAINLSEDMNPASTQDDEIILLSVQLWQKSEAPHQIVDYQFFEHTFKQKQERISFDDALMTKPNGIPLDAIYWINILIELDSEKSPQALIDILLEELQKGDFFHEVDEKYWDRLLEHDDVLDLQYRSFKSLLKSKHQYINFKGLQLFDRFEYQLYFTLLD